MLRAARLLLVALLGVLIGALGQARVAGAQAAEARLVYLAFPRGHPVWLLPVRVLVIEGASPYRDVLDLLCRGPGTPDTVVGSVLPRGSRVERLSVAGGTATVDLKPGRPEPRGRAAELAVQAIAHTLCQFPEIERVLVRVDGHLTGGAVEPDAGVLFSGFPDLDDDPRGGPVLALALRGVFSGYPDGSFRPAQPVSRAEAVKSLVEALAVWRLPLGAAATVAESAWFSDVPAGHWVLPYLREAVRKGIVPEPRAGEDFRPDAPLDGATLVDWLYRATGAVDADGQPAGGPGGARKVLSPGEAEAWLVSRGILGHREGSWAACREISRVEWAAVLAGALRLGGPDLYLATPVAQQSLEGEVVVAGAVRWPDGVVTLGVLDSRGRELAVRQALLCSPAEEGEGWGWFAEWLHFPRPLTSSAGIIRITHQPPEGGDAAGVTMRIPVFIR